MAGIPFGTCKSPKCSRKATFGDRCGYCELVIRAGFTPDPTEVEPDRLTNENVHALIKGAEDLLERSARIGDILPFD